MEVKSKVLLMVCLGVLTAESALGTVMTGRGSMTYGPHPELNEGQRLLETATQLNAGFAAESSSGAINPVQSPGVPQSEKIDYPTSNQMASNIIARTGANGSGLLPKSKSVATVTQTSAPTKSILGLGIIGLGGFVVLFVSTRIYAKPSGGK